MTNETVPTASILIIGAEVLSAKVADQNGPFLMRALQERGIEVTEMRTIGDSVEAITRAVRELSAQDTYVFSTGGVGPTHDDVTMDGMAAAFDRAIIRHPELERRMRAHYGSHTTEAQLKMTDVPDGCVVHSDGHDATFVVSLENVFVFPGIPQLVRTGFERIAHRLNGPAFFSRALLLDVRESEVATILANLQAQFPAVAIGSYPRFDPAPYRVKVTFDGRSADEVRKVCDALRAALDTKWIVGEE